MSQDSRFLGSARLIAVCTFLSRLTGLARDITMNTIFGQGWVQDAFNYGFLIPNLFRRLFGEGALAAVFIPVFTEVLDKDGRPAAWVLLGRITGLMALVLTLMVILLEVVILTVWHIAPGGPMRSLQMSLTAVMIPFMMGVCMVALFSSILNCVRHFTTPALLSIVLNIMIIAGATIVGPQFGEALEQRIYGVAVCVLAAAAIQLVIILPVLRSHGILFRPVLNGSDPNMRRMMRMFIPVLLGQGVLLFNVFFDAQICTLLTRGPQDPATFSIFSTECAYPLEAGALSAVNNAQRLYQFPLGVLAISLATAAFPMFSLYASRKDMAGLRASVAQSLRLAVFIGLPSGIVLIVLGEQIITFLFEHGRYDHEAALRASSVLRWYGLGMVAFCCQHILLRAFYSIKDTLTPMRISCWLVGLNIAMNIGLVWFVHEQAFGISTAVTASLTMIISVWFLRRKLDGPMGASAIWASVVKSACAAAGSGVAAWFTLGWTQSLNLAEYGKMTTRSIHVFVPLAAAVAVYFLVTRLLKMEELGWLLKREQSRSHQSES